MPKKKIFLFKLVFTCLLGVAFFSGSGASALDVPSSLSNLSSYSESFTASVLGAVDTFYNYISSLFSDDDEVAEPKTVIPDYTVEIQEIPIAPQPTAPTTSSPPVIKVAAPVSNVNLRELIREILNNEFSYSRSSVTQGPAGPQGIQGPQGERGPAGTSSGIDTSSFVSKTSFDSQINAIFNSIESTEDDISTGKLTASGNVIIGGNLSVSGTIGGTIATNANLTGPITSVGNATSVASQTGTGTTFVMNTSPTLVTPVLGVATGTSLDLGGTTLYGSRAITVDTGGVLNIDLSSAAGDDFTVDTNKLVVEGDTGSVGISTTTPGTLQGGVAAPAGRSLQVQTTSGDAFLIASGSGGAGLILETTNAGVTAGKRAFEILYETAYNGTSFNFFNEATGAFNPGGVLFLKNDGNVGINTTAPLVKLDVAGSGRFTGTATSVLTGTINPTASTAVVGVGTLFTTELVVGDEITVNGETRTVTVITDTTNLTVDTAFTDTGNDLTPDKLSAIFVARNSAGTVTSVMDSSGLVGIGTVAPSTKLHVSDTGNALVDVVTITKGDGNDQGTKLVLQSATTASSAYNFLKAVSDYDGTPVTKFIIKGDGNVKIAGTAVRATTEGTNHLDIFDGTAPVGTLANGISLYSTSGELRVMDAAGNATLLSPHENENNYWVFDSANSETGKTLVIDMELIIKDLNDSFELDYVHETQDGELVERDEKGTLLSKLFVKISGWLADAQNSIGDMFADTFYARDKICINQTCVTEAELQQLLENAGTSGSSPDPEPNPDPASEPTSDPEPDPEVTPDTEVPSEEGIVPEPETAPPSPEASEGTAEPQPSPEADPSPSSDVEPSAETPEPEVTQ